MTKTLRSIAVAAAFVGASSAFAFMPAAGEFSAADQVAAPAAPVLSRATVRNEAAVTAQAAHRVNGEIAPVEGSSELTRAQVREQGRTALRTNSLAVGESSL